MGRAGFFQKPMKAQARGPLVALLCGGLAPFVLRPVTDGFYTLVGEAFIHGLKECETMRISGVPTQKIRLR
jgi:hypothetical protein